MFEDTKGMNKNRKSKDTQRNGQKKQDNEQTTIYKTLHRKLKDTQRNGQKKQEK